MQGVIEALEGLTEVFKKVRKLKGSDLEIQLVKNHEPIDIFYVSWSKLEEKQLSLILAQVKLDPDDKVEQLKDKLCSYWYMHLDLETTSLDTVRSEIHQNLHLDEA